MKLGPKAMEALRAEIAGSLEAGDDLAMAGAAALGGTARIVRQEAERLGKYFSRSFLEDCLRLEETCGVCAEKLPKEKIVFYAMGEGGVLSALWKMAEASGTGLSIDLRRIPIRQETIEICEFYDLNPYRLFSRGAVLFGGKNAGILTEALVRQGIPAAVIGRAEEGNDRLLYSGGKARYLERPASDELWKVIKRE